jgi:hypothetical protein
MLTFSATRFTLLFIGISVMAFNACSIFAVAFASSEWLDVTISEHAVTMNEATST